MPGSTMQKWHSDGDHLAKKTHMPPHCLNVFIPLCDITRQVCAVLEEHGGRGKRREGERASALVTETRAGAAGASNGSARSAQSHRTIAPRKHLPSLFHHVPPMLACSTEERRHRDGSGHAQVWPLRRCPRVHHHFSAVRAAVATPRPRLKMPTVPRCSHVARLGCSVRLSPAPANASCLTFAFATAAWATATICRGPCSTCSTASRALSTPISAAQGTRVRLRLPGVSGAPKASRPLAVTCRYLKLPELPPPPKRVIRCAQARPCILDRFPDKHGRTVSVSPHGFSSSADDEPDLDDWVDFAAFYMKNLKDEEEQARAAPSEGKVCTLYTLSLSLSSVHVNFRVLFALKYPDAANINPLSHSRSVRFAASTACSQPRRRATTAFPATQAHRLLPLMSRRATGKPAHVSVVAQVQRAARSDPAVNNRP